MHIVIVTVGKLKEAYWRDACAEYIKRLSADHKVEVVELNECRLSNSPSDKETARALAEEAKAMEPYISARGAYNIAMCIEGRQLTSEELSERLVSSGVEGFSRVNFFIGSSFGLSRDIKQRCAMQLSMSKLTFPHQLARVMLLEQVYRAHCISRNIRYHK